MKLKKMDVGRAEDFVTSALVVLEGVNRLQAEKDVVIEDYYRVKREYVDGKISFGTYEDCVKRLNAELGLIDNNIKEQIRISNFSVSSISKYVSLQKPLRIELKAEKV